MFNNLTWVRSCWNGRSPASPNVQPSLYITIQYYQELAFCSNKRSDWYCLIIKSNCLSHSSYICTVQLTMETHNTSWCIDSKHSYMLHNHTVNLQDLDNLEYFYNMITLTISTVSCMKLPYLSWYKILTKMSVTYRGLTYKK